MPKLVSCPLTARIQKKFHLLNGKILDDHNGRQNSATTPNDGKTYSF